MQNLGHMLNDAQSSGMDSLCKAEYAELSALLQLCMEVHGMRQELLAGRTFACTCTSHYRTTYVNNPL